MTDLKTRLQQSLAMATVLGALSLTATSAQAQQLFNGCPSGPILERFVDFGKTGKMPPEMGKWLNTPEAQNIEPWKAFDNVDYIGICWVSAWLVHTDDGIVLIDTLYGPYTESLIAGIKAVGVDLADIKYVLMTHGHRDHVGGAVTLKPLLPNATFVMTRKGWDEAREAAVKSKGGRREWDMIDPDMVVSDGDALQVGSMTFTAIETPGHTWGTASYLYDVIDGDKTHRAITIGGLGLNAIEGPAQVEAYIASVDRIKALIEDPAQQVEVHLTTHGFSNNLIENRDALAARKPGEPHQFVAPQELLEQIATLRAGAVERLALEQAK